jgi:predicted aspartyl protease
MNKQKLVQALDEDLDVLIQRIVEADTDDFFELGELVGLNPSADFAGSDLHEVDFSGGNLQGANLRKTNLSGAILRDTNLRGADLSYSDLSGADLTGSDLTDAILDNVSAENAKFINAEGIYERVKLELIEQGAIFEKQSPSEAADPNIIAFQHLISNSNFLEENKRKWVALVGGNVISIKDDEQKLRQHLKQLKLPNQEAYIHEIEHENIRETFKVSPLYYQLEFEIDRSSMPKHGKSHSKTKVAPEAPVEIYNPLDSSKGCKLTAMIDTGAMMTLIPESIIKDLGALDYSTIKLQDASGNIVERKTYYVSFKINEHHFEDIEVIAIPSESALIGQDILKRGKFLLDGSNQTWSLIY